jgi:hypothetical protein
VRGRTTTAARSRGPTGSLCSTEHAEGSTATATRVRYKTVAIETLVARGGGEMGDGRTSDGAAQVVLTRDQHDPTGPLVRRKVVRTYERTAYHLQVLTLRDSTGVEQTLRVTAQHPFYRVDDEWTPAKSLVPGDEVLGDHGVLSVIVNDGEAHPQGVKVYNLEVEQAHTYFVLAEDANDAAAVWAHNRCELQPERTDALGRLKSRTARVTLADIDSGTNTTGAARRYVRAIGNANDDAGHLIGRLLGGPGGARSGNIFPQNPHVNRGAFAQFESDLADVVRQGNDVTLRVKLVYYGSATRPDKVIYQARWGGRTQIVEEFSN